MKTRKTKIYEIAITMIPMVGPVIARQLISYCGSLEGVFSERKKFLKTIPGIGEEIATRISNANQILADAEEELNIMDKNNIQYSFYQDETFPTRLQHIPDAPLSL